MLPTRAAQLCRRARFNPAKRLRDNHRELARRLEGAVVELDRHGSPGPQQDVALRRVARHLEAASECFTHCAVRGMPRRGC